MTPEAFAVVEQRCGASRRQNDTFGSLLPADRSDTRRVELARAAIDLAQEHHSATVRLVLAREFGAAAALLRPILEAAATGDWLVYVASNEQVAALPMDAADNPVVDVPPLGEMAKSLVPVFPPISMIVEGWKPGGAAKWLHKYAHGSVPQLNRRGDDGWSEGDLVFALIRADTFATVACCLETVLAPNQPLAAYGFGRRDALAQERFDLFGGVAVPPQPATLPEAPLVLAERM
ncbi:hypothetical protein [Xanthomonas sp. XNM01]|uniref:DUF6988 family protein n=1 Tax=Xanthomonas sp. XNM01 TaxID=2769289 RepID=UPI001785D282|nr:hypothetical protein [Xanthomonas sp. XNM01]MBD9369304.1 hypothetical protein [Xanthomonas sp. XNM01]